MRVGRSLDDLGTKRLTWADLAAVVQYAPTGNAIDVAQRGSIALYGVDAILLMQAVNTLREANWQRGGDERAPRPQLLTLPGSMAQDDGTEKYGADAIPASDFAGWWDTTE